MNRFKLVGVAVMAALYGTVVGAGEIDGVIRDRDGTPVARATITITELGRKAETDSHGHFHFAEVPEGAWTLEARDGSATAVRSVEVGAGVTMANLQVEALRGERIVVRASPLRSRSPLEMARPVTVLTGDELTRKSATSIGETIAGELGVSATSFGPGASRPVIRGLGDDRVRMLQDGIGTLDVSSVSDDHSVTIEPILADQVEILRGPATLLYGTGAIGGVVNVIDNRIPERLPAHALEGRAEVRGATATGERSVVGRLDGGGASHAWHLNAYRRSTGDIDIPGFAESAFLRAQEEHDEDHGEEGHEEEEAFGTLPNSDSENRGGAFGLSWIGDRGFIGASVSLMDNAYGIPGGHAHHHHEEEEEEEGEEHEEAPVRIAQEQLRFDIAGGLDNPLRGFERLRFRLGVNDYEHRELEGAETATVFTNKAWETRVELGHAPIAGGWEGALGVQASNRRFSAIGEEAFTPPVETDELGLFWVEERTFERFRIELGGRIERVAHAPETAAKRSFTLGSVSTGLIVPLAGEVEATLNAGRYQRAPVSEELFSDGAHLATATFERGDPTLDRETSKAVELALRDQRGALQWSVSVFRNAFDAFIYQADTGMEDPGSELPIFQYAQQD
ncbi:MAG: TonB-dependent receptor, partial [Xanthomonadaceae bacterium]|nr:TonB-dependent receptor [Xanthomonadaceae bacterium]